MQTVMWFLASSLCISGGPWRWFWCYRGRWKLPELWNGSGAAGKPVSAPGGRGVPSTELRFISKREAKQKELHKHIYIYLVTLAVPGRCWQEIRQAENTTAPGERIPAFLPCPLRSPGSSPWENEAGGTGMGDTAPLGARYRQRECQEHRLQGQHGQNWACWRKTKPEGLRLRKPIATCGFRALQLGQDSVWGQGWWSLAGRDPPGVSLHLQSRWFLVSSKPGRHSQAMPPLGVSRQMWAQPWFLFMQFIPSEERRKQREVPKAQRHLWPRHPADKPGPNHR